MIVNTVYSRKARLQEKSVKPTNAVNNVEADSSFDALSKVTVNAVDAYGCTVKSWTDGQNHIVKTGKDDEFFNAVQVLGMNMQEKTVTPRALRVITTAEELLAIEEGGSYQLGADIAFENGNTIISSFSGYLDGNGHTISGITTALFDTLSGEVINLTLAGSATSRAALSLNVTSDLKLYNIVNNCSVSTTSSSVGGFIGHIDASGKDITVEIENCINNSNIEGRSDVGGFVGSVIGDGSHIGKLIIKRSMNNGDVYQSGSNLSNTGVGGFVGFGEYKPEIIIERCINTGNISFNGGDSGAGGIFGGTMWNSGQQRVTIRQSVNTGNVTVLANRGRCGGICGRMNRQGMEFKIEYCYNTGKISAMKQAEDGASGIFGYSNTYVWVTLVGCYNIGQVSSLKDTYAIGAYGENNSDNTLGYNYYIPQEVESGSTSLLGDKCLQSESCADKASLNEKLLNIPNTPFVVDESVNGGYAVLAWQLEASEAVGSDLEIVSDSGYDGISKVIVNDILLQSKKTISNGAVTPDEGYIGLSCVEVDIPTEEIVLQEKTVAPSGSKLTISADEGYTGLSKVTVSAVSLQTKSVSPSATEQSVIADSGYTGLSRVSVSAVPLEAKTVTANGTYTPTEGTLGFSSVTVSVSQPKLNAPSISVYDGMTVQISNPSENGNFASYFGIYINGDEVTEISVSSSDEYNRYDLSGFLTESGTYPVSVSAKGDGFIESDMSNYIEFRV